jgi:glycosyltransferase involved in cell wall biosynthesis
LVVVGRQAWQCETEMKMIERATDRIVYLDYVPFTMLVTLMRSARALIFASLYEGFGLPVLEAFQCGAPVITADASSTAEVAGDAALLVDPYDICQIRDAFRALGADGTADLRSEMAEKGRRRAEAFSQDKIAARLEECYSSVMQAA